MGYIDTTELGKTTMAVKSLAVILFSGLAAAEASYGYGVALHPGYGTSYTNRSPQGLSYGRYGYGGYGYSGYGAASVSVAQTDYGYGGPQSYGYGYNINGYGKRDAEPGYGYGARSYTHRSPQGLSYGGYGYGGYGYGGYGERSADAEPGYGYGIGYGLAATAYHPYGGSSSTYRSTQGLSGYGYGAYGYGKRSAEPGYGYGSGYSFVAQSRPYYHGSYGYNINHSYGRDPPSPVMDMLVMDTEVPTAASMSQDLTPTMALMLPTLTKKT